MAAFSIIQARSHIQGQERKEAIQLSELRASGKNCKSCMYGTGRSDAFLFCKIKKDKHVKPYNICHLWKEKSNV